MAAGLRGFPGGLLGPHRQTIEAFGLHEILRNRIIFIMMVPSIIRGTVLFIILVLIIRIIINVASLALLLLEISRATTP